MNALSGITHNDNIRLSRDGKAVVIIDQTKLPNETCYLTVGDKEAMYEAIKKLRVRGAPAIGIFAAFSVYVLAEQMTDLPYDAFREEFLKKSAYLNSSRPTAVNLSWALRRQNAVVEKHPDLPVPGIVSLLRKEAEAIQAEDIEMCTRISEYGLTLLKDGDGVLTHCNAGPLATSRYGTAIGPILLGKERGMNFRVFADETRPLLQGARLTTFELAQAGVDVTLICDNMAASVMARGEVAAVMVGADRIAANGDTANKVGTYGVAVLARYFNAPFYVLAPTSTIDLTCASGADIPIEERSGDEIRTMWYEQPMAPEGIQCFNPAFDVTEAKLISAIITEGGVAYPPFEESLKEVMPA